ncbi:hypothetical protein Anas_00348 [Armadillidium nasatum]|uniref:J domain-containing protein n=1 Tax=Armadillidium nasatum TaxID=96803 RepID=A0A5N5TFD7_9CRUS|nr:hypothetical protein Anas_00348 [Armadillidium nasatum]
MFGASNLYKRSNIVNICSRKYSVSRFKDQYYLIKFLFVGSTLLKPIMNLHPDRNAQNSKNHKLAVAVNEAYAVLGKSPSRENYDHYLSHLRRRLSHNNIVSDIPYDRVVFRDRDYFYEDTSGRNRRFYEESFYRGRKGFDGEKPYYGIKGVKRLPNSYIAAGMVYKILFKSTSRERRKTKANISICSRKCYEKWDGETAGIIPEAAF